MKKLDSSLLVYPILMLMVLLTFFFSPLSRYSQYIYPIEFLILGFFASAVVTKMGHKEFAAFFRGLGVALAVYTLPISLGHNETMALFIFIFGLAIASLSSPLPSGIDLLVRGIGVSMAVLAPYLLINVPLARWPFLYLSLIIGFVYVLAAIERVMGGSFIEENIMGIIAISVLLIGYGFLEPYFKRSLGRYYIYIEWAVVIAALIIASSIVTSYFSKRDFSEYLVGVWKRHEAELGLLEDEELKKARDAIESFVVKGDASSLVAFLASYLSNIHRDELEKLLKPLVNYCPAPPSLWTPPWLVKKLKERELERRLKIVRQLLSYLKEVEIQ